MSAPHAQSGPNPGAILQLTLGFMGAKTLLSAVELGLFTELAKAPLTADEVREHLGLHPRSVLDFLDALVALKMLDRENGRYRNTPDTDLFLDRNKPTYLGGLVEMANARLYPFWGNLTEGLRTGEPQNELKTGGNLFEALYGDPERKKQFLAAMTGLSKGAGIALANTFAWEKYKTFADVGCAQGGVPVEIARKHPHLKGIGWDLPTVQAIFEEYAKQQGVADRLTFQAGDFFKEELPKVDVIVMGHILHDWNMEDKRMLLRKAWDALPEGGALIIHEALIDDERRENASGLLMSLNMLIETPGGFDYTGADCQRWMKEAGFRETRVQPLAGPDSAVIGIR